jgi:hypothetical protein
MRCLYDLTDVSYCRAECWNTGKEEIKSLNNYLDSLQTKVRNAHQVLIDANQRITTESLQNQFIGKTERAAI